MINKFPIVTRPWTWLASHFGNDAAIFLVLVALVMGSWLPRLNGPIDLRWDGSVYYILGTSLAQGRGYRLLNEPGEIEAVQYPPMLPLIVAIHQRLLSTNDFLVVGPWLRIFYFFISAGFTFAVYLLFRMYLSRWYALLAVCVCTLYMYTYYLSDVLYAETPFALVTTLFVMLNRKSERVGYALSTGALGVTAYLLRTAGIALLLAWVGESLLRGRFKTMALRAMVALLPVLLWQVYIAGVKHSQQYRNPPYPYQRASYQYSNVTYVDNISLVNPFFPERGRATTAEITARTARNLKAMPLAMAEVVSAPIAFWKWALGKVTYQVGLMGLPKHMAMIPLALIVSLVICGAVLLAARREWLIPLYLMTSAGLFCLTPWPEQFTRYLTPLNPLLALSLFCALVFIHESSIRWFPVRWKKAGLVFNILAVMTILLVQAFTLTWAYTRGRHPASYYEARGKEIVYRLFFNGPSWQALDSALEWLRRRANPDDVIATTVPHEAYVRTRLKAVLPPMVADPKEAQRLLDSVPVNYIVLDELDGPRIGQRYAEPIVNEHPDLWKCVYVATGGRARVYRRVH